MNHPIGIFGGTFDPIHLGHIHFANTIYKLCDLQKILLVPCNKSPLRTQSIASAQDRFNMVKLACQNFPHISVEDYEMLRPETSYTINTLRHLKQKYPSSSLALVMGIDVFNSFDKWHKWEEILELSHLIIASRPGYKQDTSEKIAKILEEKQVFTAEQLQNKPFGLIYFADVDPLPITATEIRTLIKQKKKATHLITPEVWEYIKDNKLYTNF